MQKNISSLALSNSIENLLFPPHKYTSTQLLSVGVYFTHGIKFTLAKYRDLMKQIFDIDDDKLWWVVKAYCGEVDAKTLLVVMMLQLVSREKKETAAFNENAHNGPKENGIMNSPRARNPRGYLLNHDYAIITQFIKYSMTVFLRLLSLDSNYADPFVDADELQALSILFKVDPKKKFSSYLPIFNTTTKLKASTIAYHIVARLAASYQDFMSLEGLSFVLTVKDKTHCDKRDIRIISCDNSEIFINAAVRSVHVVDCNKCTIHVAACEHIIFVDKCEKINLSVCTNLLRISNTHESNVYYYGTSPVILTGDIRALSIGPNNYSSTNLMDHLHAAGIYHFLNNLTNFTKVIIPKTADTPYTTMSPADFDLLVLPYNYDKKPRKGDKIESTILAPKEYIAELEQRNAYYSQLKARIVQSKFTPEVTRNLHSAIQGNFKEWLFAKQYFKNLKDIVRMLDKNYAL